MLSVPMQKLSLVFFGYYSNNILTRGNKARLFFHCPPPSTSPPPSGKDLIKETYRLAKDEAEATAYLLHVLSLATYDPPPPPHKSRLEKRTATVGGGSK